MRRHPFKSLAALGILLFTAGLQAETPFDHDTPFTVVLIDAKSEKALGPFPFDRSLVAKAVDKAADSDATGVVLKFFLDKPRSEDGDRQLAQSMKRTKVLLEARLDNAEVNPHILPDRFQFVPTSGIGKTLSGTSGWIPSPAFSAVAHDIGFVNYRAIDRMPILEAYRGRFVKSLFLSCIELATDQIADITPGKSIRLGDRTVAIDDRSKIGVTYPKNDDLSFISFSDFIGANPRPEVKHRVVIVGLDTESFPLIDTPAGKLRPHRAFVYALMSIYKRFH